jgi:hypothetical protein
MSFVETTLSSPLLDAGYTEFLAEMESPSSKPKTETARLANKLRFIPGAPLREHLVQHSPSMNSTLSYLGRNRYKGREEEARASLNDCINFTRRYCEALRSGFESNVGADVKGIGNLNLSTNYPADILTSYLDFIMWVNIVETSAKATRKGSWEKSSGDFTSRRFTLLDTGKGGWVLLTYDVVLMFKDMMFSRFLVLILGHMDPDRSYLSHNLASFINWGEGVLNRFGNVGYELIKSIESLVKVRIVEVYEKWLDAGSQARDMVQKYKDKEIALGGSGTFISEIWLILNNSSTAPELGDYFGFLKLLGHPYVNPREGCSKVQRLVHTKDRISFAACRELGYSFCHVYTRGYLDSNSRWPPIKFTRPPSGRVSRLEELARKGHPSLSFGFTQYDKEDWDYAEFLPHVTFDYGEDFLELMSDRALSHPRSEFDTMWMNKLDYNPPRASGSKRVLEQVLTKGTFDLAGIVRRVQQGDIPFEWRIVSVSPKEREMKLDPRMFSKMVLEMRTFFVLTEKNLKQGVFRVIKEQTMTLNRQALVDRFLSVTRPKGERWVRLTIEIDYSSWNLHFCAANNDPVGERLNQIYGEPGLYTAAHPFFDSCLIVMDHGQYPPEGLSAATRDSVLKGDMYLDTVWSGHDRGFEGITQGVWTLATIALGHMAIHDLGLNFTQNGQGDNQVYTFDIFVPPNIKGYEVKSYVRNVNAEILGRLEHEAERVGHVIKPEECICSTSFFSYGKEMFVDGIYLPSLSKFLSRIFPTTSSDAPSTYEYISTVASGGTAATEKSNVSLPCLAMTKLIERFTIARELKFSLIHGSSIREWVTHLFGTDPARKNVLLDLLCIVPGNLGGLPISSPLEFLYRGHSDPLASSLLGLQLLRKIPGVEEYLICLSKLWPLKKEPDPTGLVLDPYSIPLARPSPASVRVTSAVLPVLHEVINNIELNDLKIIAGNDERDQLFSWLGSFTPVYPKVLHEIYKGSTVGVLDALAKRFTNTRTLLNLSKRAQVDILGVAISSDLLFMTKVIETLSLAFKVGTTDAEAGLLDIRFDNQYWFLMKLRRGWGHGDLQGVTNLHPFASGKLLILPFDASQVRGHEELVVSCQRGSSQTCEKTRGPVTPYLGSKTDDKTVGKWVKPISSSPPLRDVIALLNIQEMMCLPETNSWNSISHLAQSRSLLPLHVIRKFTRVKHGGNNAHRFHTRDDPKGSFVNISTNWPSHLTVSSNNAGLVGSVDYPFDFQEALTGGEGILSWIFYREDIQAPFGCVLQVDITRMDPVADHIINSDQLAAITRPQSASYYVTATEVSVSSNALTAARFSQAEDAFVFTEVVPTTDSAILATVYNHLTGRIQVTHRLGRTLGQISHKRIIDLPELNKVTRNQLAEALAVAIYHKLSYSACLISSRHHRKRNVEDVVKRLFHTEVRRVGPSFYGTLCETASGPADGPWGIGIGHPDSDQGLLAFMAQVVNYLPSLTRTISVILYLRGSSSVSRSLVSIISVNCLNLIRRGDSSSYNQGKQISYILRELLKDQDELTKIRKLLSLATAVGWQDHIRAANTSPEEVLRLLRNSEPTDINTLNFSSCTSVYNPPVLECQTKGLGKECSYSKCALTREQLLDSWMLRSQHLSESTTRWAPLQSALSRPISHVLVIGIGDGFIGASFHKDWTVTGIDLGAVLAGRGHSMVDFRPPGLQNRFSLHPASWSLGGDITSEIVMSKILEEVSLQVYDLVIIDVDSVPTLDRLRCRRRIARAGVICACRVLVNPTESNQLEHSVLTVKEKGDFIWTTIAYPKMEYIIGGGAAPLGIFTATHNDCALDSHVDFLSEDVLRVENIRGPDPQIWALELLGDFVSLETPIHIASCRGLWSYLPITITDMRQVFLHMLTVGAPRRRIKAAFGLFKMGMLTI